MLHFSSKQSNYTGQFGDDNEIFMTGNPLPVGYCSRIIIGLEIFRKHVDYIIKLHKIVKKCML